jgi:5-methyltetrahydropteroyltriglutamate--homocysteine methyltransferase
VNWPPFRQGGQAVVDQLFARERGKAVDPAVFDRVMAEAVSETVRRQDEAGVDVVSDGERSATPST